MKKKVNGSYQESEAINKVTYTFILYSSFHFLDENKMKQTLSVMKTSAFVFTFTHSTEFEQFLVIVFV